MTIYHEIQQVIPYNALLMVRSTCGAIESIYKTDKIEDNPSMAYEAMDILLEGLDGPETIHLAVKLSTEFLDAIKGGSIDHYFEDLSHDTEYIINKLENE